MMQSIFILLAILCANNFQFISLNSVTQRRNQVIKKFHCNLCLVSMWACVAVHWRTPFQIGQRFTLSLHSFYSFVYDQPGENIGLLLIILYSSLKDRGAEERCKWGLPFYMLLISSSQNWVLFALHKMNLFVNNRTLSTLDCDVVYIPNMKQGRDGMRTS